MHQPQVPQARVPQQRWRVSELFLLQSRFQQPQAQLHHLDETVKEPLDQFCCAACFGAEALPDKRLGRDGASSNGGARREHEALWHVEACAVVFMARSFKDHITLQDYEIHDGMNLELYYQ